MKIVAVLVFSDISYFGKLTYYILEIKDLIVLLNVVVGLTALTPHTPSHDLVPGSSTAWKESLF